MTAEEIKKIITDTFVGFPAIRQLYGLDQAKTFDEQFSPASIENRIFYAVAYAIWWVAQLFEAHKNEVNAELDKRLTPNKAWWRDKVLKFQFPNRDLISETDKYDNTGLTAEQIEEFQVVKFCAVEDTRAKVLLKVAKGEAGSREPISTDEVSALDTYVYRIKPAGIDYEIINRQADKIFATIDIYYNALALTPTDKPVETAFKEYVQTLPFNGLLSNTQLVDALQVVTGVVLVDVKSIQVQRALNPKEPLGVQRIADSGYWIVANDTDLIINYLPHRNENI